MDRERLRLGLIGWPLSRSLSPLIHEEFLRAAGRSGSYARIAVPRARAAEAARLLWRRGMDGLNVTIPCKLAVRSACVGIAPSAREAGAVNTLQRGEEGWIGHNTDIAGFSAMADEAGAGPPYLVVGCGGAARAVAAACRRRGEAVSLYCRRPGAWRGTDGVLPLKALAVRLGRGTLVNATPLGWRSDDPFPVPAKALRGMCLLDLNYSRDWEWRRQAAAAADSVRTGEVMLVHQAAESFGIWTGNRPKTDTALTRVRNAI